MAKSILPEGTGTPYVTFFNGSNQVIRDLVYGLPIGVFVTGFKFKGKEGETTEAIISIKAPTNFGFSNKDLGPYSPIKIKWGWIYPDGSHTYGPLWNLMVIDREISFGQEGINIELTLGDNSIILKNQPASSVNLERVKNNLELLEALLRGEVVFNVSLIDYQTDGLTLKQGLVKNPNYQSND